MPGPFRLPTISACSVLALLVSLVSTRPSSHRLQSRPVAATTPASLDDRAKIHATQANHARLYGGPHESLYPNTQPLAARPPVRLLGSGIQQSKHKTTQTKASTYQLPGVPGRVFGVPSPKVSGFFGHNRKGEVLSATPRPLIHSCPPVWSLTPALAPVESNRTGPSADVPPGEQATTNSSTLLIILQAAAVRGGGNGPTRLAVTWRGSMLMPPPHCPALPSLLSTRLCPSAVNCPMTPLRPSCSFVFAGKDLPDGHLAAVRPRPSTVRIIYEDGAAMTQANFTPKHVAAALGKEVTAACNCQAKRLV